MEQTEDTCVEQGNIETEKCQSCQEKGDNIVSMRCHRHKKRFNVPEWWLTISPYLCPNCYDKLSAEDRKRYAPKCETLWSREAEEGKAVVFPPKTKEEYLYPSGPHEEIGEEVVPSPMPEVQELPSKEVNLSAEIKKTSASQKVSEPHRLLRNPALAALLPRYRITCQMCGETVPCHYTWFDKSTVLCPSCYSSMSGCDIKSSHEAHFAHRPKMVDSDSFPILEPAPQPNFEVLKKPPRSRVSEDSAWTRCSLEVNNGGCWSTERIMRATKKELLDAVKNKKVSRVRAKIELKRRANVEYYDMCPKDIEEISMRYMGD